MQSTDLPDFAVVEYDAIERATQRTLDFQHIGEFVRFVRDAHPLILRPYLDATVLAMESYPKDSPTYRWLRAECVIINDDIRQRRNGRVPWFMARNVKREESIAQRCASVHESIEMCRFIEQECGLRFKGTRTQCPIHGGDGLSFSVRNGRGKCFACGWSGDVIAFAQKIWNLERPIDAIKRLEKW